MNTPHRLFSGKGRTPAPEGPHAVVTEKTLSGIQRKQLQRSRTEPLRPRLPARPASGVSYHALIAEGKDLNPPP